MIDPVFQLGWQAAIDCLIEHIQDAGDPADAEIQGVELAVKLLEIELNKGRQDGN